MQGFTLIEILIVVFIIGLTASVISLSIGDDKKDGAPYQEARTLLQTIDFVSEYTALNGEVIAMFVTQKESEDALNKRWCYSWKRLRDNNWSELPDDTLTEHCLLDTVLWELVIEGRIYAYDPDIEIQPPVLIFSPSGEATPVEMALFESATNEGTQHIEIDMMGNSRWLEQDKAELDDEQ
jgi:general secretion pathway protein H